MSDIDLRKVIQDGKTIYLVGGAHPPGIVRKNDRQKVQEFLHPVNIPNETAILYEGEGGPGANVMFTLSRLAPPRFLKGYRKIDADTFQSHLLANSLFVKYIARLFKMRKHATSEQMKKLGAQRSMIRDFLYATAAKEIIAEPSIKNVIMFTGSYHTPQTHRFITDTKYYESFKTKLLRMAPRASVVYHRQRISMAQHRKRIQRASVRRQRHALSIRGARK